MRWLWGTALGAIIGSVLVVNIFNYFKDSATDAVAKTAKAGLSGGVFTAIFAGSGMHKFSEWVRGARRANKRFGR